MNVEEVLDNIRYYIRKHEIPIFKIGFVGDGEPLLDFDKLKSYIDHIEDLIKDDTIRAYTITNGTVDLFDDDWRFLEEHKINVGFSVDGYRELHNMYRCNSFDTVIENVEKYKRVTGHYPTFNATVGRESLANRHKVIDFFKKYGTRVTFSRMIGKFSISLDEYHEFLLDAERQIPVRMGGMDCTMYGGQCGAGKNNFFFANGKVYYCGNCIDLPPIGNSNLSLDELEKNSLEFDRNYCYKESLCE